MRVGGKQFFNTRPDTFHIGVHKGFLSHFYKSACSTFVLCCISGLGLPKEEGEA